ncbi:MAG: hypothetical protein EKK54_06040 [Neisseriaceae bacterium]|nr:MAG: hypothetical protein EKK54_06040 [Neisseriaceae bacterium]
MPNKMKLCSIYLLSCLALLSTAAIAQDTIIPDQYALSSSDSPLDNPYIVSKTFTSMAQVVTLLNGNGITSVQKNKQQNEPTNQPIRTNLTYRDFINKAAQSFNYSWNLQGNTVVFIASNPIVPKPSPVPESSIKPIIASSTVVSKPNPVIVSKALPVDQQIRIWSINKNDLELRAALSKWCKTAGWQLDWQVQGKFPIDFDWQVQGTFKDAVNQVLKASQQSDIPLTAYMFTSNKVLRITSSGK